MNKVILIGGAPTTGKSYIAKKLAKEFNFPWISTDQIRTIQKSIAEESKWPNLFNTSPENTNIEEAVKSEIAQNEIVWKGVLAFAKGYHPWEGCIIEGMAIMPHLVARDLVSADNVDSIFLIHSSDEKIKDLVFERSKLPFIKTTSTAQQEHKAQQIQHMNQRIYRDAKALGLPYVITQTETTFQEALKVLRSEKK